MKTCELLNNTIPNYLYYNAEPRSNLLTKQQNQSTNQKRWLFAAMQVQNTDSASLKILIAKQQNQTLLNLKLNHIPTTNFLFHQSIAMSMPLILLKELCIFYLVWQTAHNHLLWSFSFTVTLNRSVVRTTTLFFTAKLRDCWASVRLSVRQQLVVFFCKRSFGGVRIPWASVLM
jgi:hypothetical protein